MARSQSWKDLEKKWSEILCKYGLTAHRVSRAGNYQVSDYDVKVAEMPELISDCKYSIHSFKTNRLLDEVEDKYKKAKGDTAILVTKGYKEHGQDASCDSEFMAMLLAYWVGVGSKEDLWATYSKTKPAKETKE